jgi:outer membrane protein assembly factor BamB
MRKLAVLIFALLSASYAIAKDWPQWRGPNRNSVSAETGLMTSWSPNVPAQAWQASEVGDGYSSVVVADGLVFTMGRIGKDVRCFAFDIDTGKKRWATTIGTTSRNVMSTPTVHDGLVYALDPDGELVCLHAADGKIAWRRSFLKDFGGRLMSGRGYGESPLIDGDRLICTPGGEQAMLVALDRRTGSVIWKTSIPEIGKKGRDGAAFSSIVVSNGAGVRQYVQLTGRGLVGIETETGRFLWGYNDISNSTANIPTPIVRGDMVFSANGYHAGSVLLKLQPTKEGTGVAAKEVYRLGGNRFQNHHGGYVLIGDFVYGGHGSNNGLPTCLELGTGRIVWKRRGPGSGSAAVVAADGHLYFRYQDGVVALIEANSAGYQLKGSFKIPGAGGDSWSHPVVSHGKLFLREKDDLWVFHVRKTGPVTQPNKVPTKANPRYAALVRQGAVIEQLGADELDDHRNRLYRFALDSTENRKKLTLVTLTDQHVTGDGALAAKPLSLLRQLDAPFILNLAGTQVGRDALQQTASLKSLVGLDLELCRKLDDDSFKLLADAKRLTVLVAAGTSLSDRGLRAIARVPNLRALDLEVCNNVTDTACASIGTMRQLRGLNLKKTGFEKTMISNAGLSKLSGLPKLESLNVSGNAVTNDGLQHLQPLSRLRELDLSRLPIDDAGLTHLTSLKNLEHLKLIYTEGFAGPTVTDSSADSLSALKQLKTLNLTGARLTDDSLTELSRLKKLTHLILIDSNLSTKGIRRLRRMLPACEVVSELRGEGR